MKYTIGVCLALVAAYGILLGWGTRTILDPRSAIQRIRKSKRSDAIRLRPVLGDGRQTILLLGTSLVEAAVAMPLLRREIGPGLSVSRFVITDTDYVAWYSGLHRLLEAGARPGEFDETSFSDGFHMNASGARRYTPKLAIALRKVSTRLLQR